MSQPLLSLRGIAAAHEGRNVLSEVSFSLHASERVALLGHNGAGKTTLLHLLVGLHPPARGRITIFGAERADESSFREIRGRVGLLFQDSDDQLFCPTVLEDVAFGPVNLGYSRTEAISIAHTTLAELGLAGFACRVTRKLSGGEKRLVALAAVLAMRPEVLLLDEPTSGLDESSRERLIEYLERLPQAMLFVSHDHAFVERLATRAVTVKNRTLVPLVLHRHAFVHGHLHVTPSETDRQTDLA